MIGTSLLHQRLPIQALVAGISKQERETMGVKVKQLRHTLVNSVKHPEDEKAPIRACQ